MEQLNARLPADCSVAAADWALLLHLCTVHHILFMLFFILKQMGLKIPQIKSTVLCTIPNTFFYKYRYTNNILFRLTRVHVVHYILLLTMLGGQFPVMWTQLNLALAL